MSRLSCILFIDTDIVAICITLVVTQYDILFTLLKNIRATVICPIVCNARMKLQTASKIEQPSTLALPCKY